MKRFTRILVLMFVMLAVVFAALGCLNDKNTPEKKVVLSALQESVSIKDEEVGHYDFTTLFSITVDGKEIEVLSSYVDATAVKAVAGTYPVTCTYHDWDSIRQVSVSVTVIATEYALTLSVSEITIKLSALTETDFIDYFTATKDGERQPITGDMVTSTVKPEIGDYTFTVTYHGNSETLTVHVVSDHLAEVVLTTSTPEIYISEIETFDLTELFSLYIDGVAVQVTMDMISADGLDEVKVGDKIVITLDYNKDGIKAHGSVTATIAEAPSLIITPKNIITYPNADEIDLTTLFTIRKGDENIPVTIDMIKGRIDYSKAGENNIVLTYEGKSATAVVTVKLGVIIDYAKSDVVSVRIGTDKDTYPFAEDFIVIVNGERYLRIPDSCFDVSEVNFNKEGSYEATLTILYNDKPKEGGLLGSYPVEEIKKNITYIVVSADYELNVKENFVSLPKGTESYDPTKNLELSINGIRQVFTTRPDYVDVMTVYYELLTDIDFTSPEIQHIRLAIYVYGVEKEPVNVEFDIQITTEIVVEAKNRIVFTGETVYTKDLFTVTENDKEVSVPQECITGKVNTFVPGSYYITLSYKGLYKICKVVVYKRDLIGAYRTSLTTIPVDDDDDDGEYGDEGWGDYSIDTAGNDSSTRTAAVSPLGGMTIKEDGTIKFNGISVYSITGIDERTMLLHTGTGGNGRTYTLYYFDGIVVLDVENSLRLKYTDGVRPLVYFQEGLWSMQEKLTVNSGSQHVLRHNFSGHYSIDITHLKSTTDDIDIWYALYIRVLESLSSNTVYDVKYGKVEFEGKYNKDIDAINTIVFNDTEYRFAMVSAETGTIVQNTSRPYAGKQFSGTIDGKNALLTVSASNWYELFIENESVLKVFPNDLSNMKHGGELANNKVHLYDLNDQKYGTYSYFFSLDTETNTFILEQRDHYYGVYRRGSMCLFLDGYGKGQFYDDYDKLGFSSIEITYSIINGEMLVEFCTYDPNYKYGTEAAFYISPLLNVLTSKKSKNDIFAGENFENTMITDGAIVKVNVTMLPSGNTLNQLIDGVTIKTKDGQLDASQKKNIIGIQAVDFSHSGFYQFTVTVKVKGEDVTNYYAIQICAEIYKGNPVAINYGNGVLYGSAFSLNIDTYGRAYVSTGGTTYSGTVSIANDNKSFVVKAYNSDGAYVGIKGTVLKEGIVQVKCSGMLRYSDYFVGTAGKKEVAGTKGFVIRRLVYGAHSVYIVSDNERTPGEVAEVTEENGIYTITDKNGVVRKAQITWGDNASEGVAFIED